MDNRSVLAGIDVGKWQLHVHILPVDEAKAFVNDEAGVKELADWLRCHKADLVVLEPTGRHHRLAHNRLTADGLAVTLVNPDWSRQFAKATGKLAKTDSVDARLLAELGQVLAPEVVDLFAGATTDGRRASVPSASSSSNSTGLSFRRMCHST